MRLQRHLSMNVRVPSPASGNNSGFDSRITAQNHSQRGQHLPMHRSQRPEEAFVSSPRFLRVPVANHFRKKTDMNIVIVTIITLIALGIFMVTRLKKVVVREFEIGLLYRNGKFVKMLAPGKHRFFGEKNTFVVVDLRARTLALGGQEILTADHLGVKISLVLSYRIVDAAKALHEVMDCHSHVYSLVQIALRTAAGKMTMEDLMTKRVDLSKELIEGVQTAAKAIGVEVLLIEVRDVMLSGELKKIFNEVVKARKEGLAALEKARGESAALRNLANAARMIDDNPALLSLRTLQVAANSQTLVLGLPHGIVTLPSNKKKNINITPESE